jgi:hypothetical protein
MRLAILIGSMLIVATGAARAGDWNAYALDFKGMWAYAQAYESQAEAEAAALETCANPDCEVFVVSQSQCMALAESADVWSYGASLGDTAEGSNYIAFGYCLEGGGKQCKMAHAACLTPAATTETPPPLPTEMPETKTPPPTKPQPQKPGPGPGGG